jgi:signal transduction histidine kinase
LASLAAERERRSIDVVVGELPRVVADPELLKLAFEKLLSNAFKFTSRRTAAHVEVGHRPGRGGGAFFVRDDGDGMDVAGAKRLFEVFQRFHRQDDFPGIGVGLAIVRTIVEQHGGRIWAESEKGHGATFWFTLDAGVPSAPWEGPPS